MKKIDELKAEATELGITFSANIGEAKLQEKIDEFKGVEPEETDIDETPSWITQAAAKADNKEKAEVVSGAWGPAQQRKQDAEREIAARKTKVITIIDNDQRENNVTTSAVVTCGNAKFDLGTVVLPLNMEVEVMQGHIDVLAGVKIPQHVLNSKTGLSDVVIRPRYSISYSDKKPS